MRRTTIFVTAALAVAGVAGCAGFRTERQGRDVGRAVCDIKTADNADQAQRALSRLNRHLETTRRITGRHVGEDVQDVQNNVNDLVTHVSAGQSTLAREDVAVIQRNVDQVIKNAPALTKRYYEGVKEGLGDCT